MPNLTNKQKAFIDHYIICLNATEAAKRAGYRGANDNVFASIGSENLRKPKIKQEIKAVMQNLTMSADEVVYRLQEQAKATLEHFVQFNNDGTFWVDLDKARDAGVLHLAKELKQDKTVHRDKDGNTETTYKTHVKIHDSQSALDKLMRYHGLYDDSTRVKTWKDDVVQALIDGRLKPEDVKLAYADNPDLVAEFFTLANVRSNAE